MIEPDFISQTAEPMTTEQQRDWFQTQAAEAARNGATFHRFSHYPSDARLLLYEGWKQAPKDQGEPRFQLTV